MRREQLWINYLIWVKMSTDMGTTMECPFIPCHTLDEKRQHFEDFIGYSQHLTVTDMLTMEKFMNYLFE